MSITLCPSALNPSKLCAWTPRRTDHAVTPRENRVPNRERTPPIVPRFIRLRDAPRYLGMDKNRFNREVRPRVTVIRIGTQGIAFDRLDLDA